MRAVVCHRSELGVAEVPDPRPTGRQLLLAVRRCGICGSDLHARRHAGELRDAALACGYAGVMGPDDRIVFGHEFVGEVLEGGHGFRAGERVVAQPLVRHGDAVELAGFSPAAPGAYAERVVVESALALRVPNGLADDHAALTEPMSVALHAVRRSGIGKGQTAVVVGCGPVGLAVVAMLKAAGVRTVVASDFSSVRRALAATVGADAVVDPGTDGLWSAVDTRRYVTSMEQLFTFALDTMTQLRRVPLVPWPRLMQLGELAGLSPSGPVVFECVGAPGVLDGLLADAPLQTRVVVVGVTMVPDTFRPAIAIHKEIDLRFVFGQTPRDFHDALHLLADGKVDATPFVTGRVGLDGVASAFDTLGGAEQHAKILVDPARRGTGIAA